MAVFIKILHFLFIYFTDFLVRPELDLSYLSISIIIKSLVLLALFLLYESFFRKRCLF